MRNKSDLSRREFLKQALATGALAGLPAIIPAGARGAGRSAPVSRITLGMIGLGWHGTDYNLKSFLEEPDAQVVAVCDVDPMHLNRARDIINKKYGNRDCATHADFREVLARKDIDAIAISTPDHWHVPLAVMSARAGKDVFCEKPTLTIQEGRVLCDTIKRYGTVFQTATEDRSKATYHRLAELVRNGRIGKLQRIEVTLWPGQMIYDTADNVDKPEYAMPQPIPKGFDYEMWLGPAPYAPYTPWRCHRNFRWNLDYSGGMLTDWGAHFLDTVQWANNTELTSPISVEGKGVFRKGLFNTASEYELNYAYANGVALHVKSGFLAMRFEGSEGWVGTKNWDGTLEASSKKILNSVIGPNETRLYTCPRGEHRNFLDCVKSRRDTYFPAEVGHRMFTLLHMGNLAMLLGRKLEWDPAKEEFVNDLAANRMRSRARREPWNI